MERRIDIIRNFVTAGKNNSADFSYSATMRNLRKHQPDKVKSFMVSFKNAFDSAVFEQLENPEKIALMEATQNLGDIDA